MAGLDLTTKRIQIDKANVTVVTVVSIAAFVTIFALVSVRALSQRYAYQSRVVSAREKAHDQLKKNIDAAGKLTDSYEQFVLPQENIIGGNSTGSGERDGDNARIVLDALPSKYDFPALATSLEKIAKNQGVIIENIQGIDDEVNQGLTADTVTPKAIEMPFTLGIKGNYASVESLISTFERSIRPFVMNETILTASDDGTVRMSIKAKTFYQPEKSLQLKSEVVK